MTLLLAYLIIHWAGIELTWLDHIGLMVVWVLHLAWHLKQKKPE